MLIKSVASRFFIAAIATIDAIDAIGRVVMELRVGDFLLKKKIFFKGLFAQKNSYNFVD